MMQTFHRAGLAGLVGNGLVQGSWNFTHDTSENVTPYGAGKLNLTPTGTDTSGTDTSGTFISSDTDRGYGFDHGAEFSLTGGIDSTGSHLHGDYGIARTDGALIATGAGVYEVWKAGNATSIRMTCASSTGSRS